MRPNPGPPRRSGCGAGSIPASFRISRTVEAAIFTPRPASSPWILRYPIVENVELNISSLWGSPRASRRTRVLMFRRVAGLPVLLRMDLAARRWRTMSRCQRKMVSGVTSSRSACRRALGITPSRVASRARSAQFSFGWRCCRCGTASWWRRIKISAICHVSSCRDSRSQEATRVIRRKTNRRHMIGDHHGQPAVMAILLVRDVDGILGTHRSPGLRRLLARWGEQTTGVIEPAGRDRRGGVGHHYGQHGFTT